jgi:hypothetical protein
MEYINSWTKKWLATIEMNFPQIAIFYTLAYMSQYKVNELLSIAQAQENEELEQKVNSFYLGSIEADVNRYFQHTRAKEIAETILLISCYVDVKNNKINNDSEFDSAYEKYALALTNKKNMCHRIFGKEYSNADNLQESRQISSQIWNRFKFQLSAETSVEI